MEKTMTLVIDIGFAARLLKAYVNKVDPTQFFDKTNEDDMEKQIGDFLKAQEKSLAKEPQKTV